jgi:hypothetical protein
MPSEWDRQWAQGGVGLDALRQITSREQLHHDERRARVEHADVAHPRDERALELGDDARLADEALDDGRVREGLSVEELQRHVLVEHAVARSDDRAHPSDAQDPLDDVLVGEDGPDGDGGLVRLGAAHGR